MDDLAVWCLGWDAAGNERLAEKLRHWGGIPHVFTHTDYSKSESENGNYAFDWSEKNGFKFILTTDADVDFRYSETIPKMYEWMTSNYVPKIGSVRPWRKGEEAQSGHYPPEPKYLEDGTGAMWRLGIGLRYDEEFKLTGWIDYDLGNLVQRLGYGNYNDRRYPVYHDMAGSNSHSKSSFLNAVKKMNKLILDNKWWFVGYDNWHGVASYNQTAPLEKRIPTMNQIAAYTNEQQELFQSSVSVEHMDIFIKDKRESPNSVWENPIITGRNTRQIWYEKYGYD